jgi:hypothetical protein
MLRKINSILSLQILKFIDPNAHTMIGKVVRNRLSYLHVCDLYDLWQRVHEVEKQALDGILIEAGCALGGSAIVISAAKRASRPLFVYDNFGLIPSPSESDGPDAHQRYEVITDGKSKGIGGDPYYGYQKDLLFKVQGNFERFGFGLEESNIRLIKGSFSETLVLSQPVAFAHIDADWYDSVKICLERIEPLLVPHGILVIDDYSIWSGCRKAVDEFFCDKQDGYQFEKKRALHIIKR